MATSGSLAYFSWSCWTSGISFRHWVHQMPQKLMTTILPFMLSSVTCLPSSDFSLNFGTGTGLVMAAAGACGAAEATTPDVTTRRRAARRIAR